MNEEIRKAFEAEFHVPDYLEFDGEDYMYYGESPLLTEQQQDISAKWRGFQAGVNKEVLGVFKDALRTAAEDIVQLKADKAKIIESIENISADLVKSLPVITSAHEHDRGWNNCATGTIDKLSELIKDNKC